MSQDKTIQVPVMKSSVGSISPHNLVLYHGGCKDGFCAAWVASLKLPEDTEFLAMMYGEEPPYAAYLHGKQVYILDFSYKREVLEKMYFEAESLIVLDHHKTAEADLAGLPYCQFDMNRSGAGMTWDYFFQGEPRPWLVNYVEDRDLWRFALPESKSVNAYIQAMRYDFSEWNRTFQQVTVDTAAEGGYIVQGHVDQYIQQVTGTNLLRRDMYGYLDVPIINAAHTDISELLDWIIKEYNEPFAVGWRVNKHGSLSFSLRSRSDFDVAVLAKLHGGGGHKNAAGFELKAGSENAWVFFSLLQKGNRRQ